MRFGVWEILLIVVLVVILFGSAKIPAMMRNVANGINVFKKELKEKPTENKKPVVSGASKRTKNTAGAKVSARGGAKSRITKKK